uniref:tRNA(Ile)-lysidine synthetase n=1 Tax=Pterocladia lucida TaxID=31408 RepID=A0A6M3WVW0_PTELU|nr:TilS [Pterocladia lucida]
MKTDYIYIDHQWKNESMYHTKHLVNLIRDFKEKIYIYQIQTITQSEKEARIIRYQTLVQHALKYNYNMIMTGHTKTDKLETFFQQLFRGTSLEGITSLNISNKIHSKILITRPLLTTNRIETYWFCRQLSLPIWSDISNYNNRIKRNRIRYELMPYLSQYFGNKITNNIYSFLIIASKDNEYIKQNALKVYLLARHNKYIALNYNFIQTQHIAIQVRVLYIFFCHSFNKILTRITIYQLINNINHDLCNKRIIKWEPLTINLYNQWIYIN